MIFGEVPRGGAAVVIGPRILGPAAEDTGGARVGGGGPGVANDVSAGKAAPRGGNEVPTLEGENGDRGDDGWPKYNPCAGEEDALDVFDAVEDIVFARDADAARSRVGIGSAWKALRTVERSSSCFVGGPTISTLANVWNERFKTRIRPCS
jgi:hypothetical protein